MASIEAQIHLLGDFFQNFRILIFDVASDWFGLSLLILLTHEHRSGFPDLLII